MMKYYTSEELFIKLEVSTLKNTAVIPKTPFSGGVPPELTPQGVVAVTSFQYDLILSK